MQNTNTNALVAVTENLKKVDSNFEEILRAAEEGDEQAQTQLGWLYQLHGNPEEALRWYELAALKGYVPAQFYLGYNSTEDLDRDLPPLRNEPEEARKWIRLAAEQGHSDAICNLIEMYRTGSVGMEKNPNEAARWCLRADDQHTLLDMLKHEECSIPAEAETSLLEATRCKAAAGDKTAQSDYGDLLAIGLPTLLVDEDEAVKWHNLAAEQIDDCPWNGYQQKVIKVFERHTDDCSAKLSRFIGQMHEEGKGVEQSELEAIRWYELSAEKGDGSSQWLIAFRYDQGKGIKQSDAAAAKWYRKAAEQGLAGAQNNLALMYEQGRAVPQSYPIARNWFKRAADQGDETAQYNLGLFYLYGRGVKANERTAVRWFKKATNQGNLSACIALAVVTGDQRNLARAVEELLTAHRMVGFGVMECGAESSDDFKERLETLINTSSIPQGQVVWEEVWDANERRHWVKKLPSNARIAATLRGMLDAVGGEQGMGDAKPWFEIALQNGDIVAAYYLAHAASRLNLSNSDYGRALEYLVPASRLSGFRQTFSRLGLDAKEGMHSVATDDAYSNEFNARMNDLILELRESLRIEQEREKALKQNLSFLSHTLSNATAGAQDTIRRAARLLSTVQADKPDQLRRASERLTGQIASLALIETLVASFKLYASDPDRVRESWENEQAGDIAFVRVLALALRQVLTRLLTLPAHAPDLRRLLPQDSETLAREFVADIMVLDMESDAEAERLIAWVRVRLPFLDIQVEDDGSMRFAQGGARFVVTFAVLAEVLTNAVKYASEVPIRLSCVQVSRQMQIVCLNRTRGVPLKPVDSGGTGIAFLREICRIVGADIQGTVVEEGLFQVSFTAKA